MTMKNDEITQRLADALRNLLVASENADETGYVDGVGWLPLERIQEAAHQALAALDAPSQAGCEDKLAEYAQNMEAQAHSASELLAKAEAENAQLKAEVERLTSVEGALRKSAEILQKIDGEHVQQIAELEAREGRYHHALNRIGFYFAGTEHQHIADKVLWVLAGNSIDSYATRPLPPAPETQEDAK